MSERPLFEHISSTANDTVKLLRSLDRKRERVETGLFLSEGARHAEEALANGWSPAYAFASQAALERPQTLDLLQRMELVALSRRCIRSRCTPFWRRFWPPGKIRKRQL